jgi:hypothetical protein
VQARYEILRSCLSELQRVGLVAGGTAPHTWEELQARPVLQLHSSLAMLQYTDDACPEQGACHLFIVWCSMDRSQVRRHRHAAWH